MKNSFDIIILGAGIAGLFVANRLHGLGYNILVVESKEIGGIQTLASQGMIHGGQKYVLQGKMTDHGLSVAKMPKRWEQCLAGEGDVDLRHVNSLSQTQLMFPAGTILSNATVFAAAKNVNGKTQKLAKHLIPNFIKRQPVYELQEKVLETKSLIKALMHPFEHRILHGELDSITHTANLTISGIPMQAKAVIAASGKGNEIIFNKLGITADKTQRRPLRQIMVKYLDDPLYAHGVIESPKPRVTVTSHPTSNGKYVWYLGGNIAEKSIHMSEEEAIQFAKKEMGSIFPSIPWETKAWASIEIDRAEPFDPNGQLPPGAYVHVEGQVLLAWPTKLTFAPALSDEIFQFLQENSIQPSEKTALPDLPKAVLGHYPWEIATWHTP